jgi:hypothetical protein
MVVSAGTVAVPAAAVAAADSPEEVAAAAPAPEAMQAAAAPEAASVRPALSSGFDRRAPRPGWIPPTTARPT